MFIVVPLVLIVLPLGIMGVSYTGASPLMMLNLEVMSPMLVMVLALSLIFFSVLLFSYAYMVGYPFLVKYWTLKFLFVLSMLVLLVSSSPLSFMLGWDGLGLTSYLLVVYFSSWDSSNSGMVTVLTNRLGDSTLMWFFSSFLMGSFSNSLTVGCSSFSFLFLLTAMTKSSQTPFSSWLPQAMAAPTPVSSLVHSSTLVTAGVFLIIKFQSFFINYEALFLLYLAGWMTCLVSGVMSIIESDGKKVVALSTLNQLGLMFVGLSYCSKWFVLFHLISHAFFKSCIFIQFGFMIMGSSGTQDSRHYSGVFSSMPLNSVFIVGSVLSLLGMVYLSGFYSKELLLGGCLYLTSSISSMFMIFLLFGFSYLYSSRLLGMVFSGSKLSPVTEWSSNWDVSSLMLFLFGVCFGSLTMSNYSLHSIGVGFLEIKLIFLLFVFLPMLSDYLKDAPMMDGMMFQDGVYKSFSTILFYPVLMFEGLTMSVPSVVMSWTSLLKEVNYHSLHLILLGSVFLIYLI